MENISDVNNLEIKAKKRKHKKKSVQLQVKKQKNAETTDNQTTSNSETSSLENKEPIKEHKESKRSIKRQKYANLLAEQKLKTLENLQSKALNYLSRWKYDKAEWKFEKLRQVWLQQNLFDSNLIPNEKWEIVVEYFKGSKGHGRQEVLNEAIKIVDNSESLETNDLNQIKIQRARDIVQFLQ